LGDIGIDGRIILNRVFQDIGRGLSGFIWLKIGASGVLLETRCSVNCVEFETKKLLASQGLCFVELV
jgi:hypothetical protein